MKQMAGGDCLHAESAGNSVVGRPNGGFDIEGESGGVLRGLGGCVGVPIGEQRRRRLRLLLAALPREPTLHFSRRFPQMQLRSLLEESHKPSRRGNGTRVCDSLSLD